MTKKRFRLINMGYTLSLTNVLATKRIPSVDDLLNIVHKFIKRENQYAKQMRAPRR